MNFTKTIAGFAPISLQQLNAKAEMMARLDNKYIMSLADLDFALQALKDDFEVLDIDGTRAFAYATRYFDDAERRAYYDHHQRRRKRCKVRVRTYVDAKLDYLEVKLIEPRATTSKHRMRLQGDGMRLNAEAMAFVSQCHQESYGTPFTKTIKPVLLSQYERITLVAKEGGERLTIDTKLKLSGAGRHRPVQENICIIETKSARGNGVADKIFRSLHVQPTKRVSKFCIGMVATGQVNVRNGFLPALRKLGLFDPIFPLPQLETKATVIVLKTKGKAQRAIAPMNTSAHAPQYALQATTSTN
jgi:VTC domain